MPKDPRLPDRFAKLVLEELADMHALLLCIQDHAIEEQAAHHDRLIDELKVREMIRIFEDKRAKHADRIYADLLKRLRLNG